MTGRAFRQEMLDTLFRRFEPRVNGGTRGAARGLASAW